MMDENINESAEIQEVAEPETDSLAGAEEQEVAAPDTAESSTEVAEEEPTHQRTEMDAAFAEMRRQNQQLEREARMMREALSTYFEGETAEELSINANAYAQQRDPDEYLRDLFGDYMRIPSPEQRHIHAVFMLPQLEDEDEPRKA